MTTVDTNLQNLIINDLSQSDYESITPNADELYLTDEVIESSDIITALGYTPYNSANPNGYTSNVGTVTSVNNTQPDANGNVTIQTGGTVDQTFDGTSQNAQSGVAINGAGFLQNTATGTNSLTLLGNASANTYSINIGRNSTSMGDWNVTLGYKAYGGVMNAVAIGYNANYSSNRPGGGNHSVAIGSNSRASAGYSTAIGYMAIADNSYAIQLGYGTNSTANSFSVGFGSNVNFQLLDGATGYIPNARIQMDTTPTSGSSNAITSGGVYTALSNVDSLPSQTGNAGKFLTTDGTDASWASVAIPTVDQTFDSTSTNAQSGVAIAGAGFVESSSLEEIQCVVETYSNGASWYRVYSDGWCEQGATINSFGNTTVTFLKPFRDTNYNIFAQANTNATGDNAVFASAIINKTSSSVLIRTRWSTSNTGDATCDCWFACGYIEV